MLAALAETKYQYEPDTRYFYRVHLTNSPGNKNIRTGPRRTFRTAPAPQAYRNVSFTVTTSHHYVNRESDLGFESYEVLSRIDPNFNVLTGDNVYYDTDPPPARELAGMRFHWHRMYSMPRLVAFYSSVPAYFMKDDHDYRFDDADPYMPPREGGSPDDSLGRYVFLEQAPVPAKTFRSVRWGAALEIWFPEGRDFRSPNGMPDGPGKTLWGVQQRRWLKESIRNSNALFKMLCSPTALLGPDRANKVDGHANRGGFFTEGQNFLAWLKKSGINNFYITCGDRHWKYHSVHLATGYEEFCSGALTDGASVSNPDYSDLAVERKWYLGNGGFLLVRVEVEGKSPPEIVFDFYDRQGQVVHTVSRKFQK